MSFVLPLDEDGKPDFGPVIEGSLAEWRAANPGALVANVSNRVSLCDEDFAHLVGVKALDISREGKDIRVNFLGPQRFITDAAFVHLAGIHTLKMCGQSSITDAAFMYLAGIHTLDMSNCNQVTISDAAFAHLHGIHTLDMAQCNQPTITDAAFAHLQGIHTLNICSQPNISNAAFAHLRGIHTLKMGGCNTITDAAFFYLAGINTLEISGCKHISDAAFAHLSGIHTLEMGCCRQITDAAFVHLTGIHTLNMSQCKQHTITDAAFKYLRGIHTLDMSWCFQTTITSAAFAHLAGIHTLNMTQCKQRTITDAAFKYLRGIHTLHMGSCDQSTITSAAFAHLSGIHTLSLYQCKQPTITDAAFAHLNGIHTLTLSNCNQVTITDAAFAHLKGIHTLNMYECDQSTITDAAFAHLKGIHTLVISGCKQFTDAAFVHLAGIHKLEMYGCNQLTITDAAFSHLGGIHKLDMSDCNQSTITDAAFAHLSGIYKLEMKYCNQPSITDAAFAHLRGIHTLEMDSCNQTTITDAAFAHLSGIHTLSMRDCNQPTITGAAFVHLAGINVLTLGNDNYDQRFFAAQYFRGSTVFGLSASEEEYEMISWLYSVQLPLPLDVLWHPAALLLLRGTSTILPSLPLSQTLVQFLKGYLAALFSALADQVAGIKSFSQEASLGMASPQSAAHWWYHFIETCGERVCSVLEPMLHFSQLPLRQLVDLCDKEGRTVYSVSKAKCRALFDKYLFLFGRYDILSNDPRGHSSPTSCVIFAHDRSPMRNPTEPSFVALKLMRHEEHFKREQTMRADNQLLPEYVMGIVRTHMLSAVEACSLDANARDFVYVLVLPAGDKVCSTIVDSESQRSDWAEATRTIMRSLATSLAHVHSKSMIHGDIKPRNIVRVDASYKLIDLDAAVRIGDPAGVKTSTAFAPPELLACLRSTASGQQCAPLLAHPSFDMWSLGVTLFLMLQQAHLFASTTIDTLAREEEDGALLAAWPPEAHAAAVQRLRTEDRTARALVFDLLQHNPALRPSAAQVLQHPYLTRQLTSARLGGEQPEYDVFISYRVATEGLADAKPVGGSGLVLQLYNALVANSLRVFVDFKELKDGKNWKEGFCAGAASSRVFVPLLSTAAFAKWSALNEHSFSVSGDMDNVLLEHRLAVELLHRGSLSHIFPVFVDSCRLHTPDTPIPALESAMAEQLQRAGLSLPFTPPLSVAAIWRETGKESQGAFLTDGEMAPQLQDVAKRIQAMCYPAAVEQPGSSTPTVQQLQGKLVALTAELARKDAELAALRQLL